MKVGGDVLLAKYEHLINPDLFKSSCINSTENMKIHEPHD